jgi:hypothetical protein
MNKSPINFGGLAGIAAGIRGKRGRGRLGGRINKLENQMQTIMRDRNKNYDMSASMEEPEFDVATESQPGSLQAPIQEDVLTPMNAFSPGTMGVANAMFGSKIPGSFDRDLGN